MSIKTEEWENKGLIPPDFPRWKKYKLTTKLNNVSILLKQHQKQVEIGSEGLNGLLQTLALPLITKLSIIDSHFCEKLIFLDFHEFLHEHYDLYCLLKSGYGDIELQLINEFVNIKDKYDE
jgi:hypothetical protein